MIDRGVEKFIKQVVADCLNGESYRLFLFGSRVSGKHRRFSDFDVGIQAKGRIAGHSMQQIKSRFEESDLPYKIDVVDFSTVSDTFKRVVQTAVKVIH